MTSKNSSRNGSSGYPRTSRYRTRERFPYHRLTSTTSTPLVMQISTPSSRRFLNAHCRCSNESCLIYVDRSSRCVSRLRRLDVTLRPASIGHRHVCGMTILRGRKTTAAALQVITRKDGSGHKIPVSPKEDHTTENWRRLRRRCR